MITPNKVVALKSSALGMTDIILEQGPTPIEIVHLFQKVENKFESIDQFLLTLDLLYVLDRIDIDFKTRTLLYVD